MAARGDARVEDADAGVLCDGDADLIAFTNCLIRDLGIQEVDLTDLRRAEPYPHR